MKKTNIPDDRPARGAGSRVSLALRDRPKRPPRSKRMLSMTNEQVYELPTLQKNPDGSVKTIKYRNGAAPKFDYNSLEFYAEILRLAAQGLTDEQLCTALSERLGESLAVTTFVAMKNGKYEGWTPQENKTRSKFISDVLRRGKIDFVNLLKSKYVAMALGQIKTKNVSTVKKHLVVNGEVTDDEVIQTTETVVEYPPNMQALGTLLHHYAKDWRRIDKGEEPEDEETDDTNGVNPTSWVDLMIRGRADEIDKLNKQTSNDL